MTLSWIKKPDWTLYYWKPTCVWACVFLNLMLSCCLCFCVYACLRVCLRACVCALRRLRCCSCSGATRRCPSRLTWSCSRGCGMSCWNSSWWNISGAHRAWSWSPCPSSLPPDTLNMVWIQLRWSVVPVLLSASVAPDVLAVWLFQSKTSLDVLERADMVFLKGTAWYNYILFVPDVHLYSSIQSLGSVRFFFNVFEILLCSPRLHLFIWLKI